MSGFSAEWLALREPFDAAARSRQLVTLLRTALAARNASDPLEVLDLGAGAGSNLRFLAPLLGGAQRWRLADHDPRLLEAALARTRAWAAALGADVAGDGSTLKIRAADFVCDVRCERVDLAVPAAVELPPRGLVTAAALLDLVSADWLDILAARCRVADAAACFALTYDGRTAAAPIEPEDGAVLELFNRHQLGDKGFGPALGPRAAAAARSAFEARSFTVRAAVSDWVLRPEHGAIQLALLDGWLAAADEIAPERRGALAAWHARRRAHVEGRRSTLIVGHIDLVGWPTPAA